MGTATSAESHCAWNTRTGAYTMMDPVSTIVQRIEVRFEV
jgi:hypothetical protein